MMRLIERESNGTMKPGQDLVVAGYAGLSGSRLIAKVRQEELLTWFSREYLYQMQQEQEAAWEDSSDLWKKSGATEWEAAEKGGIYTALWNLSGAYQRGFEIDLHQIPVKQETIEICERYDLNPYRLYSRNCMLLAADNGGHLVSALKRQGISAKVIGTVSSGIKREISYGQVHGFLERPKQDEIYKIIQEFEI